MFNKKHLGLLILFICFVASGLIANYVTNSEKISEKQRNIAAHQSFETLKISQSADILFGTFYITCRHLVKLPLPEDIRGLTLYALVKRYSPEDGWVVDTLNPKRILIYKKQAGLCPDCASKRHLGQQGDFVAVYRGPVGINGGVERVTDIKVQELPKEFKEKVRLGLLDFKSEDELMQALDTIDEYEQ